MMMKRLSIFPLLLLFAFQAVALGKFKFEKEVHDFGIVKEGELAIYEFKFKNIGDEPIIMSHVKASCGCTTPIWTKDPVMPGMSGVIKVQYNSKGRVGVFNKSITITSNAEPAVKKVYIKGIVEKVLENTLTAVEMAKTPLIEVEKNEHNFGQIELHSENTVKIKFSNTGTEPLKVSSVSSGCNCITFKVDKDEVKKGESATLTLTYKPRYEGEVTNIAYVHTNDLKTPKKAIFIKAKVAKSLSNQSIMNQGGKSGF